MNDPPDAEAVLSELKLTRGLTIQMFFIGTLGFLVAFGLFQGLYQVATDQTMSLQFVTGFGGWNDVLNILVILFLATVILVPHELIHGFVFQYYGGEPRYGVGVAYYILPFAYTTTDHRFTRDQFLVVLLAPLIVMTAVGVPLMLVFEWGWLILPLAANAGGAVGDIWMTVMLLGFPSRVSVEDHEAGVRIIGRTVDRPRDVSIGTIFWETIAGAAVASVGMVVVLSTGGSFILPRFGVDSFTIGIPGTITHLFSFTATQMEVSASVGPGLLVVGALLGLLYALVRTYLRGRK